MEQIPATQSLFEVDDLIVEILSWFPVKSLIRFRCVCKSLNSLISESNFVKLHLHGSVARKADFTHLHLLFRSQNASEEGYALCSRVSSLLQHNRSSIITERHRLKDKYQVVGSCNGLICLSYRLESEPYYCWVRFWNPTTRLRSRKSPPLNRFGFGYYHLSDTYKGVAISEGNMSVYSSGANCWRSIEYFPAHLCLVARDGVYVSGTLNWLAFCKTKPSASSSQVVMVIVSLDLGTEMNWQLLLPCGIDENNRLETDQGLWVLKDSLCFYHDH